MKAHGRPWRRDDRAISSVLGAILVFGLLVIVLTTVQVRFVPVWTKQREAAHMEQVVGELSLMKSDLDRALGNRTQGILSDPITLASQESFGFFRDPTPAGTVSFTPSATASGFTASSTRFTIVRTAGGGTFAQGEQWVTVPNGGTLSFVTDMLHFRLNLTTPATPVAQGTTGFTQILVTDTHGASVGRLYVNHFVEGDDYTVDLSVFGRSSNTVPLSHERTTFDKNSPPANFFINLLQDDFLFGDVLRSTDAPYSLTMTTSGMTVKYTAVFRLETSGGGSAISGAGGLVVPNWSAAAQSGTIGFDAENKQFVDQEFFLEHGAVLMRQGDVDVMKVPPSLRVTVSGTQVNLAWGVPALQGDPGGVGGSRVATATFVPGSATIDVEGTAPQLTFAIPTLHAGAWSTYLDQTLRAAGVPGSQFTLATTPTSCTLTIVGPNASATVDDLSLQLRMAGITAILRPAG